MAYTWKGMRKLTIEEAQAIDINEPGGLTGYFILRKDGSESLIEDGYTWEEIEKAYDVEEGVGIEK